MDRRSDNERMAWYERENARYRNAEAQRIADAILAEHDPKTQIDAEIEKLLQNKPVL